jgi:hypothetical protein
MIRAADALKHCRAILEAAAYDVEAREVDELGPILIAETLYALVMAVAVPEEGIERFVEDAQAALTRLAAVHPSPRSWDLYLVLVLEEDPARYDTLRESFDADTRYARKLVVTGDRARVERSLRILLPIRPVPEIALADPLEEVRSELKRAEIDVDLLETALSSFERTSEVQIP